jgi:hypothetical protein
MAGIAVLVCRLRADDVGEDLHHAAVSVAASGELDPRTWRRP